MKKRGAIIRLVIWSLIAIILTLALIFALSFKNIRPLDDYTIGFSGNSYKNGDSYDIGEGSIKEEITSAEINWVSGTVTILAYDGAETIITESDVNDEDYRLRYKVENGRLIIHSEKSGFRFGAFKSSPKKELTVKLPRNIAENLTKLNVNITSADLNIKDIKAYESINIDNTSGKINIENVTARSLDIDTVSGDAKIIGSVENLNCDSVSGKINLTSKTTLRELECDTTSGDITVHIPDDSGFTLEFDSASGDFNTDFQKLQRGDKHIVGDGSAEFEVDSVSGDLTIKKVK